MDTLSSRNDPTSDHGEVAYKPCACGDVPAVERILCGLGGIALMLSAVPRHSPARWTMMAAGSALFLRGVTGWCPLYRALGVTERNHHPGVRGNRGRRIEATVDIRCPADKLYRFWHDLEQLPRVLRHVESVHSTAPAYSHWLISGPARQSLEWDAEIINQHENRLIAWQSLPGAAVRNAGSVRFDPRTEEITQVKVAMEFDPLAGALGIVIADLLGQSPELDLREDLERFRRFAETELHHRHDAAS